MLGYFSNEEVIAELTEWIPGRLACWGSDGRFNSQTISILGYWQGWGRKIQLTVAALGMMVSWVFVSGKGLQCAYRMQGVVPTFIATKTRRFLTLWLLWKCVYVRECMHVSACMCMHVCVYTCGGQRSTMGVVSCELSNLFFETVFYWDLDLADKADWSGSPRNLPASASSALGLQAWLQHPTFSKFVH